MLLELRGFIIIFYVLSPHKTHLSREESGILRSLVDILDISSLTNIYNEARKNRSVKNVKKPISYLDAQKFFIFRVNVTRQIKYTFQPFNSGPYQYKI